MGKKEETIKRLARKYNIDPRVVRLVVDYPFKFTKERMADMEDWRPIRIRYLAVFLPKSAGNEYTKSSEVAKQSNGNYKYTKQP